MKLIQIALASFLAVVGSASAGKIKGTIDALPFGQETIAPFKNATGSWTGLLVTNSHGNRPEGSSLSSAHFRWFVPLVAQGHKFTQIAQQDPGTFVNQTARGVTKDRGLYSYPMGLANLPLTANSPMRINPVSAPALQVPDAGGSMALLGLSIFGLGSARTLFRKSFRPAPAR